MAKDAVDGTAIDLLNAEIEALQARVGDANDRNENLTAQLGDAVDANEALAVEHRKVVEERDALKQFDLPSGRGVELLADDTSAKANALRALVHARHHAHEAAAATKGHSELERARKVLRYSVASDLVGTENPGTNRAHSFTSALEAAAVNDQVLLAEKATRDALEVATVEQWEAELCRIEALIHIQPEFATLGHTHE